MNEFIGSRAKVCPVNQTVDQTCVQYHICSEVACHHNSLFKTFMQNWIFLLSYEHICTGGGKGSSSFILRVKEFWVYVTKHLYYVRAMQESWSFAYPPATQHWVFSMNVTALMATFVTMTQPSTQTYFRLWLFTPEPESNTHNMKMTHSPLTRTMNNVNKFNWAVYLHRNLM